MNTPSPLIPQGATPPRPKNSLYIKILMVLSVHVVVIGGMLMQGCNNTSPKEQAKQDGSSPTTGDTASMSTAPLNNTPTMPAPAPIEMAPVTNPNLASTSLGAPLSATPPQPLPSASSTIVPSATTKDLAPPAALGEAKEYAIVKGDTLAVIAHKNGLSLKALEEANPNLNPKKLQIGQKVQIPAATAAVATTAGKETPAAAAVEGVATDGSVYVVKSGDILLKIAKAHGTTVKKIMAANDLKSTSIRAGQKLKLPAAKTAAVEPATATAPTRVSATPSATGSSVAAN